MVKVHQIFVILSLFLTFGYCKKCQVGDREIEMAEDFDCDSFTPVKRPHNVISEIHADQINVGVIKPYFWEGFPFPPNSGFPPKFPGVGWPSHWFRRNRRRRPRPSPDEDIEECPDKGIKFISHPTDCSLYILCVEGDEVATLECPGNLHFSRDTRTCVHPMVAECEDFDFECDPDDPSVSFIPDVTDCNAYFMCLGGNQVRLTCPPNQHWNFIDEQCQPIVIADCPWEDALPFGTPNAQPVIEKVDAQPRIETPEAQNIQPEATEAHSRVARNAQLPPGFVPPNGNGNVQPAARCPAIGVEQIPVAGNCEEFVICINGQEFPRSCPVGLKFCQEALTCLPPEIAVCGPGCPSIGIAFLPHEDDCNLYYICFNGVPHIMRCPSDTHWSVDDNQCMDPLEAGCKKANFECPETGVEQIPYPYDCEKYILCVNGMEFPLSCAPGLHFSPELRICTAPELAECEERLRGCPDEDDPTNLVFLPNEEDCNRYYLCWGGNQIPMSCPAGLHWSTRENACMDPNDADCEFGDFECPEDGVENIPHPDSCTKFFLCVNGSPLERECPGDLYFSPYTRTCVHPDLAGCGGWECPAAGVTFIPDPTDCESYFLCFNGQEIPMRCGGNMHWSILDQTCMPPNDANCPFFEDGEEPWIEQETCPPMGVKPIPHATSCRQYILCINGAEVLRDCPPSTEFCTESRTCVHPLVAKCAAKFKAASFSSSETCPSIKDIRDIVFHANPQDCESYLLCLPNDQTVTMRCAKGFHWSSSKQKCMTQDQAQCRA